MGRASKDKRDVYYRRAKVLGYRARSAFKLEAIDQEFSLLDDVHTVVDLCGAPGSWSQYVARRMRDLERPDAAIVSVDLQAIAPIPGVKTLQADITRTETVATVAEMLGAPHADIVISDGAPDVTGLHDLDEYVQAYLVLAALNFAMKMLKPGGAFVAKVFRCRDTHLLYAQLRVCFESVVISKPRSSRNSSVEGFVVCQGFCMPDGYVPTLLSPNPGENAEAESLSEANRVLVPFISAGDLSGYDADMSYAVDSDEECLPPVAPPKSPPYTKALKLQRGEAVADLGGAQAGAQAGETGQPSGAGAQEDVGTEGLTLSGLSLDDGASGVDVRGERAS